MSGRYIGEYIVQRGDLLSEIVRSAYGKYYGQVISEIVRLNSLKDADKIRAGDKLYLPKLERTRNNLERYPESLYWFGLRAYDELQKHSPSVLYPYRRQFNELLQKIQGRCSVSKYGKQEFYETLELIKLLPKISKDSSEKSFSMESLLKDSEKIAQRKDFRVFRGEKKSPNAMKIGALRDKAEEEKLKNTLEKKIAEFIGNQSDLDRMIKEYSRQQKLTNKNLYEGKPIDSLSKNYRDKLDSLAIYYIIVFVKKMVITSFERSVFQQAQILLATNPTLENYEGDYVPHLAKIAKKKDAKLLAEEILLVIGHPKNTDLHKTSLFQISGKPYHSKHLQGKAVDIKANFGNNKDKKIANYAKYLFGDKNVKFGDRTHKDHIHIRFG